MIKISREIRIICPNKDEKGNIEASVGVYVLSKCIMRPYSNIVIIVNIRKQAQKIMDREIKIICQQNESIQKTISSIKNFKIFFHNGSLITIISDLDDLLGQRATEVIIPSLIHISETRITEDIMPMICSRQTTRKVGASC